MDKPERSTNVAIRALDEDDRHRALVRDRWMLRALLARPLGEREREAFAEMRDDVERTGRPLTERRRAWVEGVCRRVGISPPPVVERVEVAMGPRVTRPPRRA